MLKKEKGFSYENSITVNRESLGSNFDELVGGFYREYLHTEEEARLVMDGAGYIDVRNVRVQLNAVNWGLGSLVNVMAVFGA